VDSAFPKIFHTQIQPPGFSKGRIYLKKLTHHRRSDVGNRSGSCSGSCTDMKDLSQVITAVGQENCLCRRNHDNYANHAVQLEFIKDLSGSGVQITIGMEMFQKPFQPVLDEFIKGSIDQKTSSKKTEYFKRWASITISISLSSIMLATIGYRHCPEYRKKISTASQKME